MRKRENERDLPELMNKNQVERKIILQMHHGKVNREVEMPLFTRDFVLGKAPDLCTAPRNGRELPCTD